MQKLLFCCLFSLFNLFNCEELSFELPDKEQMCFHDILIKGVSYFLEYQVIFNNLINKHFVIQKKKFFQVIEGGNYDINVLVRKPDGSVEYAAEKKQYDRYQFISQFDGLHELCFDNTFSTYSHKFVYFEFSKENNDEDITEGESPMTQVINLLPPSINKVKYHS